MSDLGIEPAFYSGYTNRQDFVWTPVNNPYAIIDSATGTVKGQSPGTVTIYRTMDLSDDGLGVYRLSFSVSVDRKYLGELQYWYDDEQNEKIGKWDYDPKIYFENLSNNDSTFYFDAATNSAVNQWNNALDISMSSVPDSAAADIIFYGGTAQDLVNRGLPITDGTLGVTVSSLHDEGEYYTYGENEVSLVHIRAASVGLVSQGLTNSMYIKTATHELGHALGFLGHITDSTAIMTQGIIPIDQLTDKDINHLKQIYD